MAHKLELRNRRLLALDILVLALIPALATSLRLDGFGWWPEAGRAVILFTATALLVKLPFFFSLRLYDRYWRYAGVTDLTSVLIAVGLSTAGLTLLFVGAHASLEQTGLAVYRTVPLIDGLLTCLAIGGIRLCHRGLYHWHRHRHKMVDARRVLIVGAGEAGTLVVREMRANRQLGMEPVAFVDDNPAKRGTRVQGLPVLGTVGDIHQLVKTCQVQGIVVAIPSAPLARLREIIAVCEQTGVVTESVPGVYELLSGSKTISRSPKVDTNRLLRRDPVVIDQTEVAACLGDAVVLITGAGGSIGSELCRQVSRFGPKELILLGHGENSIFEIDLDLRLSFPNLTLRPVIADVRDQERINRIVEQYRPDIIFHAAAHKHVPFMEANVDEAIANNVYGTQNVLQAAEQHRVGRFVLISTDKAINSTSIMGTTKRLAELLVVDTAHRSGLAYLAVRFGNVLGSRGSVIPVFLRQIAAGGPLTITHPEMRRYFMTIPEAVQLVLQATVLGQGGEVCVLDMGEPVRILDLANDVIRLHGLEPGRDIQITYTGVRPGEKLSEELFLDDEHYQRTKHHKIFVARNGNYAEAATVTRLVNLARQKQIRDTIERAQAEHIPLEWPLALSPGLVDSRIELT